MFSFWFKKEIQSEPEITNLEPRAQMYNSCDARLIISKKTYEIILKQMETSFRHDDARI